MYSTIRLNRVSNNDNNKIKNKAENKTDAAGVYARPMTKAITMIASKNEPSDQMRFILLQR